jgi:uncharacterized protein (DUF488 family)
MPGICYSRRVVVHTVGHSVLALPDFLALLARHGIRAIADVRRYPASRRHPHFERDALAAALADAGLVYRWFPGAGGRRTPRPDSPHVAWRNASFRAYADHMDTAEFTDELGRILALAAESPTAVMCAEAVPWRCHRQLLADALVARGVDVRHVVGAAAAAPHGLTPFARVIGPRHDDPRDDGPRVVYDRAQLELAASRSAGDRR